MPDCPTCQLGSFVVATFLGYACSFCGAEWPCEGGDARDANA